MFHSAGQHEEKLIQNLALLFLIVTHGYFHFSFFIIIVQIGKVNLVGRRNRRIKELCRLFILFLMPSLFTSLHFNILRHLSFTAFLPPFNFSPLTSFLSLSLSLSLSLPLSLPSNYSTSTTLLLLSYNLSLPKVACLNEP